MHRHRTDLVGLGTFGRTPYQHLKIPWSSLSNWSNWRIFKEILQHLLIGFERSEYDGMRLDHKSAERFRPDLMWGKPNQPRHLTGVAT